MAADHTPTADGTDLTEVPAERPPDQPPPCRACPKWDGLAGERGPFEGVNDLFAHPWFHDCREAFREGRATGDFGDPDPFTRAAFAAFDEADRRTDQREAWERAVAAARLAARRS